MRLFEFYIERNINVNVTGRPERARQDIRVYARTKEDMMLFLKQHNFNLEMVEITYIDDDEFDEFGYETCILQDYRFRSNKTTEIFTIKTTAQFVNHALTSVGDHISDCCIFGSAIFRDDFEFIKILQDSINALPYMDVMDFSILDGSTIGPLDDLSWMNVKKDLLFTDEYEPDLSHIDASEIYDALERDSDPTDIQPITIEAYVRSFSEEMLSIMISGGK